MTIQNAWNLVRKLVEISNIKIVAATKIYRSDYFRVSLGTFADLSFLKSEEILIVRSCMIRLPGPAHPLFKKNLNRITDEFSDFFPSGSFIEIDETALEVDPYQPYRINLRKDYRNDVDDDSFEKDVEQLNRAAKDWVLLHHKSVMDKLKSESKL